MFENINAWRANGMLGGAMAGMAAPYDLARAQAERRQRDLSNDINDLRLQEERANLPLNELVRQLKTQTTQEELGAWDSGQMAALKQSGREAEMAGNRQKMDSAKLAQMQARADYWLGAHQFLQNASPADLAGDGYQNLRKQATDLGIDLPESYSPEVKAKAARAAEVAIKTRPFLTKQAEDLRNQEQRMLELQVTDQNAMARQANQQQFQNQQGRQRHQEALELERLRGTNRVSEATVRASVTQDPKTHQAYAMSVVKRIAEGAFDVSNPRDRFELDIAKDYFLHRNRNQLQNDFGYKLAQIKAMSEDPAQAAQAQTMLESLVARGLPSGLTNPPTAGGAPQQEPPMTPTPQSSTDPLGDQLAKKLDYVVENGEVRLNTKDPASMRAIANAVPSGTIVILPNGDRKRKP